MTENLPEQSPVQAVDSAIKPTVNKSTGIERRSHKTRSRIVQIIGVVILMVVLVLVWRFFGDRSQTAVSKPRAEVVPVEIAKVTQKDVPIQMKSIGNVEALST